MSKVLDQARDLVRQSGSRVTSARIAVLAELLAAGAALTHQDLQARLDQRRSGADPCTVAGHSHSALDQPVHSHGARQAGEPADDPALTRLPAGPANPAQGDADRDAQHGAPSYTLDRVTLYRVLDWLVDVGLAHRVPDPDRVMRFSVRPDGSSSQAHHGHFRCTVCQQVFCLADSPGLPAWIDRLLPEGFAADQMELTVSGRCARCA